MGMPHPAAEQLAQGLPLDGGYDYVLAEALFGSALALPRPPFRTALYAGLITDLCAADTGLARPPDEGEVAAAVAAGQQPPPASPTFPPAFGAVVGTIFRAAALGRLHPAASAALAAIVAQHLASTGLLWPWDRWAPVLTSQPPHAPQRRFASAVVAALRRLTFHGRVAETLPDALKDILLGPPPHDAGGWPYAPPPEPPAPAASAPAAAQPLAVDGGDDDADIVVVDDAAAPPPPPAAPAAPPAPPPSHADASSGGGVAGSLARTLLKLVELKTPDAELWAAVAGSIVPRVGAASALGLLATCLFHRGRASTTHLEVMLSRHEGSVRRAIEAVALAPPPAGSAPQGHAQPVNAVAPLLSAAVAYHSRARTPGALAICFERLIARGLTPLPSFIAWATDVSPPSLALLGTDDDGGMGGSPPADFGVSNALRIYGSDPLWRSIDGAVAVEEAAAAGAAREAEAAAVAAADAADDAAAALSAADAAASALEDALEGPAPTAEEMDALEGAKASATARETAAAVRERDAADAADALRPAAADARESLAALVTSIAEQLGSASAALAAAVDASPPGGATRQRLLTAHAGASDALRSFAARNFVIAGRGAIRMLAAAEAAQRPRAE